MKSTTKNKCLRQIERKLEKYTILSWGFDEIVKFENNRIFVDEICQKLTIDSENMYEQYLSHFQRHNPGTHKSHHATYKYRSTATHVTHKEMDYIFRTLFYHLSSLII